MLVVRFTLESVTYIVNDSKWLTFKIVIKNKLMMNIVTHVILNKMTKYSLLLKLELDLTLNLHFYLDVQISTLTIFI